jgi:hypothetical protein
LVLTAIKYLKKDVLESKNRMVRENKEIVCGIRYQITPHGVIVIEEKV